MKTILWNYNLGFIKNFDSVFYPYEDKRLIGGMCMPFSKRIFISTNGRIYPCERINYEHSIGTITDEVNINFNYITNKYNRIYEDINHSCSKCYYNQLCSKCHFLHERKNNKLICNKFLSKKDFDVLMSEFIYFVENNPHKILEVSNSINSIS